MEIRPHSALESVSKPLAQSADHSRRTRSSLYSAKWFSYIASVLLVASLLIDILIPEIAAWNLPAPAIVLSPGAWTLWNEREPINCATPLAEAALCPAQSSFSKLWSSPKHRGQSSAPTGPFWLGMHLGPEQLKPAVDIGAHHLILGWVRGSYEIWINGEKYDSGQRSEHQPLVMPIPISWFASADGLNLAIRIAPEPGVDHPDVFAKPFQEQITTSHAARAYLSAVAFYKIARPFTLLFLNLIFSLLFFFVWATDVQNRESFYLAFYLLVCAGLQLRLTDLYIGQFSPAFDYGLDLILRAYEGLFGLFVGLAFARTRRLVFRCLLPLGLALPWLTFLLGVPPAQMRGFAFWIEQTLMPGLIVCGSVACFFQWYTLRFKLRHLSESSKGRRLRLLQFGFCLVAIALTFRLEAFFHSVVLRELVWRSCHFGLVFMMFLVVLREFREQRLSFMRSPVSKYHRRIPLPESLSGILLVIDLKSSELFSRLRIEVMQTGNGTSLYTSPLWTSLAAEGGTVLSTDGDQVKVFFDAADDSAPLLRALKGVDSLHRYLANLSFQLAGFGLMPEGHSGIAFRAGLAAGEIRPHWQILGSERTPLWLEAGRSTPFIDSARMLDLERQVENIAAGAPSTSRVMIPDHLLADFSGFEALSGTIVRRGCELIGKHGRVYRVAVYELRHKDQELVHQPSSQSA